MIEWYKKVVFENYANFKGRARRREYWYFELMNIIIIGFLFIVMLFLVSENEESVGLPIVVGLIILYVLAIVVPTLAVIVRRLHDINKSGTYYFVRFIPLVGPIWLLVMLCEEGTYGPNNYGKDPKMDFDEIDDIGQQEANY